MRKLSQADVDRLMRSNRNLAISLTAFVVLVVLGVILLIATDTNLALVGAGPLLGVGIGLVMLLPQQALLRELGITAPEARVIIQAEKARRNPTADLSLAEKIQNERRRARIWLAVGLVSVVILIASASYFFPHAGRTVEEDAPTDYWFAISFFAGFIAFIVGSTALWQSSQNFQQAALLNSLTQSGSNQDDDSDDET